MAATKEAKAQAAKAQEAQAQEGSEDETKYRYVNAKLTDPQMTVLDFAAEEAGVSKVEYVTQAVLERLRAVDLDALRQEMERKFQALSNL